MKKRLWYALATLLLLTAEVCIALFVHDKIIRPYIGDVLVVILLYTFIRIFLPEKHGLLPLWVFLFAVGVECLQQIHIADLLGVSSRFLRILLGSCFDVKDILCYAAGCGMTGIYEYARRKTKKSRGL